MLKMAWKAIDGKHRKGECGMEDTRRYLMAMCVAAQVGDEAQTYAVEEVREQMLQGKVSHFVLCRHHDSTPHYIHFGNLHAELCPHARFPHKAEDGKWRLLDLRSYQSLHKGAKPGRGIVELFAQHASLHWQTTIGKRHDRDVLINPQLLVNNRASSIYNAVENAIPAFSIEKLREVMEKGAVRFSIISELPDGHSANVRKRCMTASELPENVLYHDGVCAGHRVLFVKQPWMFKFQRHPIDL